jgi:hypothetical protein
MPTAAILELKTELDASIPSKDARAANASENGPFAANAAVQRRELAMLLRSIKTMVRQSPS